MKNVTLTVVIPNVLYTMGAGEINYYTNNINNLMKANCATLDRIDRRKRLLSRVYIRREDALR